MVTGVCFLRAIAKVAQFSCWGHAVVRVARLDLSPVNRHLENEMKLLTSVIAALGIATVSPAFAEHAYQVNDAQSNSAAYGGASDGSYSSGMGGKTRAEVYAELVQAQKDGMLPLNRNDYPPSQQIIQRNRDLYRATH